jgi:hypothetical protein
MAMLGDHIKNLISADPEILFPENLFDVPSPLSAVKAISKSRKSKKDAGNEPANSSPS